MSPLMKATVLLFTCLNVLGCAWLIWWTARKQPGEVAEGAVRQEVWDGDLRERNNPMPRWWLILFYLTIVFALLYFLLYPAVGRGVLGWSESRQYDSEVQRAQRQYAPVYAAFAGESIAELATDPRALALGHSLFATNCINCHGSDGRGAPGFPDLTDNDWLYGGTPEDIVQSITYGREGTMPPIGAALGEQGVDEVIDYVLSLSGHAEPADKVAAGRARFVVCAGCHGADGKGNRTIGAPDLTADIWLYGGSPTTLRQTLMQGRHGKMPAHQWLGADRIRVLAAYVYSLSHPQ
jgi:cytochrome c oxidase cbb3-type subunit III